MSKRTLSLAGILLVVVAVVVYLRLPPRVVWPALPTAHVMQGRGATDQDVRRGDAAFALEQDGRFVGIPEPITIPQYAWSYERELGGWRPAVIVQAERIPGGSVYFGVRRMSGTRGGSIAIAEHIVLLGSTRPSRYATPPPVPPDTHAPSPYAGASVNVVLGGEQ